MRQALQDSKESNTHREEMVDKNSLTVPCFCLL